MPKPEGAAQDLVAEADAEVRELLVEHGAQQRHLVVGGGGVAGAVGHEEAVGVDGLDVVEGGRGGQHVHPDAALGEADRGHALDAQVDRGDAEPRLAVPAVVLGLHRVGLVDADFLGQPGAFHRRAGQDGVDEFLVRGAGGVAGEDAGAHGLVFAQVAGDGAGVDALDADDALLDELVVQGALGAPVGGAAGGVADDVAGHPDAAGLGVVVVDAGVADVRRGLDHELAGVGGVGDGLLVAGHAGGEDGLAQGGAGGAVAGAAEDPAVFEHEDGGGRTLLVCGCTVLLRCCHFVGSVTLLLSTIGICLRGCGDQILEGVEEHGFVRRRARVRKPVSSSWEPSIQLSTSRPSFSTNLPAMPLSCRTPVRRPAGMKTGPAPERSNSTPSGCTLSSALVRMPRPWTAIRSSQSPAVVEATYWPSAAASGAPSSGGNRGQGLDVGLAPEPVAPADRDQAEHDGDQRRA